MKKDSLNKIVYFMLNAIGDKFDAIALKQVVDYLFVLSEKIFIHFPPFLDFYIAYYHDIIDQEIKGADISQSTHVLHIGCGSIPATSLLLAEKTKAHVICVDKDNDAITHAQSCVQLFHLTDHIEIKDDDALQMDLGSFEVIIISQGITPKQQFMDQLSHNITRKQTIILRSFTTTDQLDEQDGFLTNSYQIKHISYHKNHGSTISIFLAKKES